MSHAYVVRPKVDKSGETEKIRYYGVPVTSGQVSTEQLATCISTRCTLSRGEILAAIIEIGREIQFQLDMGYTINLHGIGTLFIINYSLFIEYLCFFDPDRKLEVFEIHLGRVADHIRNFH